MVDDGVRREFIKRSWRIAEAHQDRRHAGILGRPQVHVSPTTIARDGTPPACAITWVRWPGSGFDTEKVSRPAMLWRMLKSSSASSFLERYSRLLVHTASFAPAVARVSSKRGHGAGKGSALGGNVRLVMNEELGQHLVDILISAGAAERVLDHHLCAEADRLADGLLRNWMVAPADQGVVKRVGEAGAVSTRVPSRSKTIVASLKLGRGIQCLSWHSR